MFDGYILCGTPRTGSTLLCRLLAATKRVGEPDSFYRRQNIAEWAEEWGLPSPDSMEREAFERLYLAAAIRAGKAGTGLFGMRLMRENLEELQAILDRQFPNLPSDRARLEAAFGRLLFLHLSRADKLAQAISLIKAQQSGLWHRAPAGTEIERLAPAQEPRYDFALLRREVAALEAYDAAWNDWFAAEGIEPLRLDYDSLSADPAATLIRISEALGVEAPAREAIRPGVAKLADATSLEWMERYKADLAAQ